MKGRRTLKDVERRIAEFSRINRRMPTYSEMMALLGVRSKSVVHFWIKRLVSDGALEKGPRGFLRPLRRSLSLPLVGEIQAGLPSPAEEELRDILSLDDYLITRPESSFILRVSGDSMIGEGIKPGDLVIVEKGKEPKNGDVVLAQVDGEWTMKYFQKRGGEVVLESANEACPPIRPREDLRVGGVISAVIRKYHHG